jgi:hypothetical protein
MYISKQNIFIFIISLYLISCGSGNSSSTAHETTLDYGQVLLNGPDHLNLMAVSDIDIQDSVNFELILKNSIKIKNLKLVAISSDEQVASVINNDRSNTCILSASDVCTFKVIPHKSGKVIINFSGMALLEENTLKEVAYPDAHLPALTAEIGSIYIGDKNNVAAKGLPVLNLPSSGYLASLAFNNYNNALYIGVNEQNQGAVYIWPNISNTTPKDIYQLGKLPMKKKIATFSNGSLITKDVNNQALMVADSNKGLYELNDLVTANQNFIAQNKAINVIQDFINTDNQSPDPYATSLYAYDANKNFYHYNTDSKWEIIGTSAEPDSIVGCTAGDKMIFCLFNNYDIEKLLSSKVVAYDSISGGKVNLNFAVNPFINGQILTALDFFNNGKVYLGDNKGNLYYFTYAPSITTFNLVLQLSFSNQSIKLIQHDLSGNLYIGTYDLQEFKDRLYIIKRGHGVAEEITWFNKDIKSIRLITINSIFK